MSKNFSVNIIRTMIILRHYFLNYIFNSSQKYNLSLEQQPSKLLILCVSNWSTYADHIN